MDRQIDGQINRQMDRQMDRQIDGQVNTCLYGYIDGQVNRKKDEGKGKVNGRKGEKLTDQKWSLRKRGFSALQKINNSSLKSTSKWIEMKMTTYSGIY